MVDRYQVGYRLLDPLKQVLGSATHIEFESLGFCDIFQMIHLCSSKIEHINNHGHFVVGKLIL